MHHIVSPQLISEAEVISKKKPREAIRFIIWTKKKPKKSILSVMKMKKSMAHACEECGIDHKNIIHEDMKIRHIFKMGAISAEMPANKIKKLTGMLSSKEVIRIEIVRPKYPTLNNSQKMIKADKVKNKFGFSGKGIKVAVLDTGVDKHNDLNIIGRINYSSEPDRDYVGHGTHVAGIIAGNGHDSSGKYVGVAPDAQILSAKVLGQDASMDDDIVAGMEWAMDNGAQVINMSLGGPGHANDILATACNEFMKKGIVVCVAAGNSGPSRATIESPGMARHAITVGSVDKNDVIPDYSCRGPVIDAKGNYYKIITKPDLVAPGGALTPNRNCYYDEGIISCKSKSSDPDECDVLIGNKRAYAKSSGTSMATPQVCGAAAVLLEIMASEGISYSASKIAFKIKKILMKTTDDLGKNEFDQGAGRLNLYRAVNFLKFVENA